MENIAKLIYDPMELLITENFQPDEVTLPNAIEIIAGTDQITAEGGKLYLAIEAKPFGAERTVQWSSTDEEIAVVDTTGIVTAKNDGTVTITAKSLVNPNVTATFTVSVSGQAPAYTLTYDANLPAGCTDAVSDMPEANAYAKGQTELSAKIPALRYYIFAGWALSADADASDTVTELNVTGNVTVYAVWRIADRWNFETENDLQGIAVENGFHIYVRDGMLTAIATGTDAASGNVLCLVSPELNLESSAYSKFVVTMQNTERKTSTQLRLVIMTDQGQYTFDQPVTTTEFTTYTFDISAIQGVITGFRLTPTDLDCSINVEEMGFQS